MSQERKDLIEVYKLLASPDELLQRDEHWLNGKTDIELLKSIVDKLNQQDDLVGDPLLPCRSSSVSTKSAPRELWTELDKFNNSLRQNFTCRRQMQLNRLDCTVESFKWKSTEHSETNDKIHQIYDQIRISLKPEPSVTMSHLLALRLNDCDTLLNEIVSSTKTTDCKIIYSQGREESAESKGVNLKQVIIPDVPDRGGRPEEIRAPQRDSFARPFHRTGPRGRGKPNQGRHR